LIFKRYLVGIKKELREKLSFGDFKNTYSPQSLKFKGWPISYSIVLGVDTSAIE
jgi:hypothetical protein